MPNKIDTQTLRDIIFDNRRLVRVVCVGEAGAAAATEMIKDGVNTTIFVYYGSDPENKSVTRESVCEALTGAHTVIVIAAISDCDVDILKLIGRSAQSIELLSIGIFSSTNRSGDDHNLVIQLSENFDTVILEPIGALAACNEASVKFLNQACAGLAEISCGRYIVKATVKDLDEIFSKKGKGFIGFGRAAGAERGPKALNKALTHLGLGGLDLSKAQGALFILKINTSVTDASSRMTEIRALMKIVFDLDPANGSGLFSDDVVLWFTAVDSDTFNDDECSVTVIVTGFS